jgi:hypothetical protein
MLNQITYINQVFRISNITCEQSEVRKKSGIGLIKCILLIKIEHINNNVMCQACDDHYNGGTGVTCALLYLPRGLDIFVSLPRHNCLTLTRYNLVL